MNKLSESQSEITTLPRKCDIYIISLDLQQITKPSDRESHSKNSDFSQIQQTATDNILYVLRTTSVATETIKRHIIENFKSSNGQLSGLSFEGFEGKNVDELKKQFGNKLHEISKQNTGKTLIIGISLFGNYKSLQVFADEILEAKAQNPNYVFMVGGSNFPIIPDTECIEMLKDYGVDIIGVGGAGEINTFLKDIQEEALCRDNTGNLQVKNGAQIPSNFLLTANSDPQYLEGILKGSHIKPSLYSENTHLFYTFSSSCNNYCHYCSIDKKNFGKINIEESIREINTYLINVDHNITLRLADPNPLQGNFDTFITFLNGLNRDKIDCISMFGDFMSLSTEKGLEKVRQVLELFKTGKLKDKSLHIDIAIDSIKFVGDGEFIGRSYGNKKFGEEEHKISLTRLEYLMKDYASENIKIYTNLIFHPAMDGPTFNEKIELMEKLYKTGIKRIGPFPLRLFANTQLEKKYHQYVIPQYLLHKYNMEEWGNQWSVFFKNAALLDIFACLWYLGIPEIISLYFKDFKNRYGYLERNKQNIKCLYDFLLITQESINHQKNTTIKERFKVDFQNYIKFMIEREKYISGKYPENIDEKTVNSLINSLEEFLEKV